MTGMIMLPIAEIRRVHLQNRFTQKYGYEQDFSRGRGYPILHRVTYKEDHLLGMLPSTADKEENFPAIEWIGSFTPSPLSMQTTNWVLTGKVVEVAHPFASSEEEARLIKGKKILEAIAQRILFSSNYLRRSPVVQARLRNGEYTLNDHARQCERVAAVANFRSSDDSFSDYTTAQHASKYNVGNCGDMACAAYFYTREIYPEEPVFYCTITGGDHGFILLGPAEQSSFSQEDLAIVVVDPWAGSCYPSTQIWKYLKRYLGQAFLREEPNCPYPALASLSEANLLRCTRLKFPEPERPLPTEKRDE